MNSIEPTIWIIHEKYPEWIAEAEELGVDQNMQSMVQFLVRKYDTLANNCEIFIRS